MKKAVKKVWNAVVRASSSWGGIPSGVRYGENYGGRTYYPQQNYVGANYIRGRNGQPVGYQTYSQALYYQSAADRYQVQVQRAKDLRTDDGIDARNYGVNKLPKGWSSNDYNVSGQRGTLVIDELGRRRITIDHNTGITNYYGATGNIVASKEFKKPISGSGKEKASNIPSWAAGERPYVDENGNDFAKRLLDEKYGKGNWKTGPKTEHNELKKYGDRGFK